jgi:hypothetical protein
MNNNNVVVSFFIEGQEHLRFVETYIHMIKDLGYHTKVSSLENLEFHRKIPDLKIEILMKDKLREYFKNLSSDWLFTTTPGVGSYYFPKSKKSSKNNSTKYVYLFHSLVSPNEIYIENSFKKFDFIFSPNEIITQQLKYVTSKNTKIYTLGYPVLNYYNEVNTANKIPTILIAPSWGHDSFVFDYDFMGQLITYLSKYNEKVVLRPHPMHLEKIKEDSQIHDFGLEIDINKNLNYLKDVTLLVTDWSGISLEYYHTTKNPTIFIDTKKKTRRKKTKKEYELEFIEEKIRNIIGITIKIDKKIIANLKESLKQTNDSKTYLESIFLPVFTYKEVKSELNNLLLHTYK